MKIKDTAYQALFNLLCKNDSQNVFTPPRLIRRILTQINFNFENKILVWYNIEFLIYLVKEIGLSPKNIYIYTNTKDKLILQKQGYNVVFHEYIDFDKISFELKKMKFDVVLGNPPYQEKVGPKKTESLWNKFFHISMELLNQGGYLSLIHPSGWRNITGKFKNVQTTIKSKKVNFLSIHNEKDGMETFGAETRYDYYVLQNIPCDGSESIVRFQDGEIKNLVLSNMEFIPNGGIDLLNRLIAKEDEETVELIYSRSDYGTDKNNTSKEQTDEFIYPVVYTVNYLSQPTFYYSSTNQKGHYGKPKVIWSNGRISSIGNYIDSNGEYALTQFAYAIVDTVENLENIKKALDSKEFKNLMELCAVGQLTVNHKVVAKFKKDFWKEFIDE
jgi:hypothetical protein